MPLTPADVHNVVFKKPPIGKRGYDEDEVDAFLDVVEAELSRLIEENNELRAGGRAPAPPPRVEAPEPAPAPLPQTYRITTVHPRTYNDARQIGEHFRDGGAVIMNLTELDDADAKRLVDFAAGLIFGLRGSIERVTAKVFLLSPRDVDVTAEDKARIREGGFVTPS